MLPQFLMSTFQNLPKLWIWQKNFLDYQDRSKFKLYHLSNFPYGNTDWSLRFGNPCDNWQHCSLSWWSPLDLFWLLYRNRLSSVGAPSTYQKALRFHTVWYMRMRTPPEPSFLCAAASTTHEATESSTVSSKITKWASASFPCAAIWGVYNSC